uniref:Importin-7/11-like TPR repeats domain-containing protein n=1 Tax=Octactis speculum TaxID=3111310 RepID=A0A7S2DDA8_9STRA
MGMTDMRNKHWLNNCLPMVLEPLPGIWADSEDQNLLRKSVLSLLTLLVRACGGGGSVGPGLTTQSTHAMLKPLVMPMLEVATDTRLADNDYLIEDGLELWKVTVLEAPDYSMDLDALFPNLCRLLSRDLEFLQQGMAILDAYVVIGGRTFLTNHAGPVSEMLFLVVGDVSARGAPFVSDALESLLRSFSAEGSEMLLQSGVLTKLLQPCLAATTESGTRRVGGEVVTLHLTTLARVLLTSPNHFAALLTSCSNGNPDQVPLMVMALVGLWLEYFDEVGHSGVSGTWRRKLWACTLVSVIPFNGGLLLGRLDEILNVCTDLLSDRDSITSFTIHSNEATADDNAAAAAAATTTGVGDAYTHRLRQILMSDPVHQIDLRSYIDEKMSECARVIGQVKFEEALSSVEPVIIKQLQQIQPSHANSTPTS